VARELHDTTAQSLSSLAMNMQILDECAAVMSPRARRALADSASLVEECLSEVRSLAFLLHPPVLDQLGLGDALSWFVAGYSDRSKIKVHLSLPPELGRLAPDVELTIYRIVQESLVNVQKHSTSEVASIAVSKTETHISVEIRDEGCGLEFPSSHKVSLGVGIPEVREGVRELGGQIRI
jgi:signal transduction histidine kinase